MYFLCRNWGSFNARTVLQPPVGGAKIKGVTYFCLNENPTGNNPYTVEVCVALKKRQVALYTISEDRIVHNKDISIQEAASVLVGVDVENRFSFFFTCSSLKQKEQGYYSSFLFCIMLNVSEPGRPCDLCGSLLPLLYRELWDWAAHGPLSYWDRQCQTNR